MGLQPATSGAITFEGTELSQAAEQRARVGIGYVPQGREIFPQLTVEENLRIGLGVRKNSPRTIPARIFELFPVLKQMLHRRGGDLFGPPRPRPATQAPDPRRAHRRHSAQHRPRHRRHRPPAESGGRSDSPVSRTETPLRQRVLHPRQRPPHRRRPHHRPHRRRRPRPLERVRSLKLATSLKQRQSRPRLAA